MEEGHSLSMSGFYGCPGWGEKRRGERQRRKERREERLTHRERETPKGPMEMEREKGRENPVFKS